MVLVPSAGGTIVKHVSSLVLLKHCYSAGRLLTEDSGTEPIEKCSVASSVCK